MKDSYYGSLGKALVQAVGETLGPDSFPPSVALAWQGFFATVSGCMMIAGDGVAPRRQRVVVAVGERTTVDGPRKNHPQGFSTVSVGWERSHDGTLSYRVVPSQVESGSSAISGEHDGYRGHQSGVGLAGGGGIIAS